jgi:hypothetical protein
MTEILDKMNRYAKVICADGFEMSVQANQGAYCTPRISNADKYKEVEVGFPSAVEPMLLEYIENDERPTDTVYPYVPVQVVTNVIARHGGMIEGNVPPGVIPLRASAR